MIARFLVKVDETNYYQRLFDFFIRVGSNAV